MRILAIDFGRKRIGVAVSDEGRQLARPVKTIAAADGERRWRELAELVSEFAPSEIVVGDPRRMDGSPGTLAREIGEFVAILQERFGISVVLWDEVLTTLAADEKLLEAGLSRRKRREKSDQAAAAVILQDYLDTARRRA